MLDLAWMTEQPNWAAHFAHLLRDRLHWAINHVLDRSAPPERLSDHFESLLHLIGQARDRVEVQPLATAADQRSALTGTP